MSDNQKNESNIFDIDWCLLTEHEKKHIINSHVNYTDFSTKFVYANGVYTSNIRSLIIMLLVVIALSLHHIENRTILFIVACIQFTKTFFSRLFESNAHSEFNSSKQELSDFIENKIKMNYKNINMKSE